MNTAQTMKFAVCGAAIALGLALTACAPKSPEFENAPAPAPTPYPKPQEISASKDYSKEVKLAPKVDILFVMDTSQSMHRNGHIQRLHDNVDQFVASFKRRHDIDFQIGVVTVWDDEERFASRAKWPMGKLIPLKNASGEVIEDASAAYLRRQGPWSGILAGTLKVDAQPRHILDARGKVIGDAGGPEIENFFSPTIEAIMGFAKDEKKAPIMGDDGKPRLLNTGFVRPDAHLAIIFVTDADDTSAINSQTLYERLYKLKGSTVDRVSSYGVLALGCGTNVDPALKPLDPKTGKRVVIQPTKLLDFIKRADGFAMDLCNVRGYGRDLARIGRVIEERTTQLVSIPLEVAPQPSTLEVTYNGEPLPFGEGGAWSFNSESNAIQIRANHPMIAKSPGGSIGLRYLAVDLSLLDKGEIAASK